MITRMTAAAWWDTCPGQRSSAPSVAKKESGKKHPLSWSVGKVQRMPHLPHTGFESRPQSPNKESNPPWPSLGIETK